MIKIFLILFILAPQLSFAQVSEERPDTLVFKIRNRINGYSSTVRNFDLQWRSPGPGLPVDALDLNTDLQGDTYNNTWLWQTYDFNRASTSSVISPVLPEGCTLDYMIMAQVETREDFHVVFGFKGRSCIALGELLTKHKLRILFTDVPIYEEEGTTKDKLYMEIDDLHHSHMTTDKALNDYEVFVNSTDDKALATFVSFDFPEPASYDKCETVDVGSVLTESIHFAGKAKSLTAGAGPLIFLKAIGEFSSRIFELADPQGLTEVKRCEKKEQYLSPAPRDGLLKDATSIFYFSLSSDFKMLMQTNKQND